MAGLPHVPGHRVSPVAGPDALALERARFERGVAAYRSHDYTRAATLLLPVAGRGEQYRTRAGAYLARMYERGLGGLPRDPAVARYWQDVSGTSRLAALARRCARWLAR